MDIVGYINTQEPVASWTTAKKQKMLDRFCEARGYEETVIDNEGNIIPNPLTRKEFMNSDLENYIIKMFRSDAEREARETLVIEEIDFII